MTVVFYDTENIGGFRGKSKTNYGLKTVYDSIISFPDIGDIVEHRAYCGRAQNNDKLKQFLQGLNISLIETKKPIEQFRGQYKNFTDLHIFMDALHFAYTNPEIQYFAFVSYDCDFLVIAERLTQMGKKAIVFNKDNHQPIVFIPPVKLKNEVNKSNHINKTLKSYLEKHRGIESFDDLINKTLDKCIEDEVFHSVLCEDGINISTVYQQIKNIPRKKSISFKQNGEKKMPSAFAKALLYSKFCVVQKHELFYIMKKDSVAETAIVILP